MRLFIPTIGDHLRLCSDWTFGLTRNSNSEMLKWAIGQERYDELEAKRYAQIGERDQLSWEMRNLQKSVNDDPFPTTLVEGTVLSLGRIYIRSNYRSYDSLTFTVLRSPDETLALKRHGGKRAGSSFRFYASLADCNTMDCEIVPR